ncbi:type II toxin-antitoxin system ParD family antitoxin [Methylobacterium sp. E-066]|uniref:ribbon-helix-helix domain-containing protein n=1 Tax=Methylobacterium sp. E-066 TaxID=2836584 RepID=UPI001FB96F38|nr:type II toxin-antitoxin system ParD family antitoxin [Methylobacterium sp. E-066]MCJ2138605.1 type II toxin-antitoxin system ParD family antitoxin [Methylobacterium sp. E-066]
MPAKHSRHIALTATLSDWIDSRVAKGEYTSTSDLIGTVIRLLRSRDEGIPTNATASSMLPPRSHGQA